MSRQRSLQTIAEAEYISIGELARLTGTRYSTLKFYTEEGMIPFQQPEKNLTRRYKREEAVARILGIKKMRAEGKSVPEIREMLGFRK